MQFLVRSEINLFEIITKQNVQGVPVNALCSVFSVVSEISLWFKIQSDVDFFEESHTAKIFRNPKWRTNLVRMIRLGSKSVCGGFQDRELRIFGQKLKIQDGGQISH